MFSKEQRFSFVHCGPFSVPQRCFSLYVKGVLDVFTPVEFKPLVDNSSCEFVMDIQRISVVTETFRGDVTYINVSLKAVLSPCGGVVKSCYKLSFCNDKFVPVLTLT